MKPILSALLIFLWLTAPQTASAQPGQYYRLTTAPLEIELVRTHPDVLRAAQVVLEADFDLRDVDVLEMDVFGEPLRITRDEVAVRSGGWVWEGTIAGDGEWALLSYQDGRLAGQLMTGSGEFEIMPMPDGGSVLMQRDEGLRPIEAEPIAPEIDDHPPTQVDPFAERGGLTWIDVAIMYTVDAANSVGGHAAVSAIAHNDVAWANRSFRRTNLPIRFRLVRVGLLFMAEDTDTSVMLPAFRESSQAINLRNLYGADMMGLYLSSGADACGRGYVMRNPGSGFADWAFQVTSIQCRTTFAHEHGHNMGMEHDPDNGPDPAEASYPWSFGHGVADGSQSFRTVMAYASVCDGNPCPRIAAFSTPDWNLYDHPLGIANQRDNNRTALATGPVVASFRTSVMLFQNGFD